MGFGLGLGLRLGLEEADEGAQQQARTRLELREGARTVQEQPYEAGRTGLMGPAER